MKYGELTLGQVEALVNKLGGLDGVKRVLSGGFAVKALNVFRLTVNYDLSVEDMVKLGKYDWASSDITSEHFPVTRSGKSEVKAGLICFNLVMSSDDVLREFDKLGYRPAGLAELLAFGATYPEEQRKYPIAAPVWRDQRGDRRVACLYEVAGLRLLSLLWLESDWFGDWQFLAVRK